HPGTTEKTPAPAIFGGADVLCGDRQRCCHWPFYGTGRGYESAPGRESFGAGLSGQWFGNISAVPVLVGCDRACCSFISSLYLHVYHLAVDHVRRQSGRGAQQSYV